MLELHLYMNLANTNYSPRVGWLLQNHGYRFTWPFGKLGPVGFCATTICMLSCFYSLQILYNGIKLVIISGDLWGHSFWLRLVYAWKAARGRNIKATACLCNQKDNMVTLSRVTVAEDSSSQHVYSYGPNLPTTQSHTLGPFYSCKPGERRMGNRTQTSFPLQTGLLFAYNPTSPQA